MITSEDSNVEEGCGQGRRGTWETEIREKAADRHAIRGGPWTMDRLWVGGKEAQSYHVLRRSKTSGRKGDLVEQAGRRKRKKQVIQVRRVSRLWDRMLLEGKVVTGEKIVLRVEIGRS